MKTIYSIKYKGVDINFLQDKGFVGYNFKVGNETFGYKIPLTTKKQIETFGIVSTLTINAVESVELKLK